MKMMIETAAAVPHAQDYKRPLAGMKRRLNLNWRTWTKMTAKIQGKKTTTERRKRELRRRRRKGRRVAKLKTVKDQRSKKVALLTSCLHWRRSWRRLGRKVSSEKMEDVLGDVTARSNKRNARRESQASKVGSSIVGAKITCALFKLQHKKHRPAFVPVLLFSFFLDQTLETHGKGEILARHFQAFNHVEVIVWHLFPLVWMLYLQDGDDCYRNISSQSFKLRCPWTGLKVEKRAGWNH
jgi:hypothetical protein